MPHFPVPSRRLLACSLLAPLLLSLGGGCASVSPTAPANPRIVGNWQLDKSASDLVDAKVSAAIAQWQERLRKHYGYLGAGADAQGASGARGGHRGGPGGSSGQGGPSGPGGGDQDGGPTGNGDYQYANEDFDAFRPLGPDFNDVRRKLILVLTPPDSIRFDVHGEVVRIAPDSMPARDYQTDEEISRIDEYGTAKIDAGWSGDAFELQAHYSSHARLIEHFAADPGTNTLTVSYHLQDPMVGKIDLNSVYRRK
jgi:hypothetical protein